MYGTGLNPALKAVLAQTLFIVQASLWRAGHWVESSFLTHTHTIQFRLYNSLKRHFHLAHAMSLQRPP